MTDLEEKGVSNRWSEENKNVHAIHCRNNKGWWSKFDQVHEADDKWKTVV